MIDALVAEDERGLLVRIPLENFSKSTFTLFGMTLDEISRLRHFYLLKGGRLPITKENINELD